MHLVSSRERIQTQICSSKPHIFFVLRCEWALNKNKSFHSTPKPVSLNVIHSRIITYKDYYHQDLECLEGFEWMNTRRIPRDMLPADSHRVLSWGLILNSLLSYHAVASGTAWVQNATQLLHPHCSFVTLQVTRGLALSTGMSYHGIAVVTPEVYLLSLAPEPGVFPCLWPGVNSTICACDTSSCLTWLSEL